MSKPFDITYEDGRYFATPMSAQQVEDMEKLGIPVAEIPDDIVAAWEKHCEASKKWQKYWKDSYSKLLDDDDKDDTDPWKPV